MKRRNNFPSVSLNGFLRDCVEQLSSTEDKPVPLVPARLLYEQFVAWCQEHGAGPLSQKCFARAMAERGFVVANSAIRAYRDLRLRRVGDADLAKERADMIEALKKAEDDLEFASEQLKLAGEMFAALDKPEHLKQARRWAGIADTAARCVCAAHTPPAAGARDRDDVEEIPF